MGATFTLTSVTCTAPFGDATGVARGILDDAIGNVVYSTLLRYRSSARRRAGMVSHLPRAGEWCARAGADRIARVAAAVNFVSNADLVLAGNLTRNVLLIAWARSRRGRVLARTRGSNSRREWAGNCRRDRDSTSPREWARVGVTEQRRLRRSRLSRP